MASLPFNPPRASPVSPRVSPSLQLMKDLSNFLLKRSLAPKMKRGVRSVCTGVGSTTTMNQNKTDANISCDAAPSLSGGANISCVAAPSLSGGSRIDENDLGGNPRTLEEMLLQLEIEEAAARRAKLDEYGELNRRMSCVNSSDMLSSARSALSRYPRFSLDGKDAMYHSFRNNYINLEGGRKSVDCSGGFCRDGYELDVEKSLRLPPTVAGECVVWCKPGVVARLMGLDAVPVPVPVPVPSRSGNGKRVCFSEYRKSNLRKMGRYELEKDRIATSIGGCRERRATRRYCAAKPISVGPTGGGGPGGRRL